MGPISVEQFLQHPDRLLSGAQGEEIALASRIVGLSISEMIDELGTVGSRARGGFHSDASSPYRTLKTTGYFMPSDLVTEALVSSLGE